MNKQLLLAIVLISAMIISLAVGVPVKLAKAEDSKTLIVPDDFPTIQDAIGNASAGDTVFVKEGTYAVGGYNGITIDKSISLVGQDSQSTIIEGGGYYYANSVIDITADNVTVSGFTINGNVPTGVDLESGSSNCKITDNIVENNSFVGIITYAPSENNVLSANNITNNGYYGIYLASSDSVISGNIITNNTAIGIIVDSSTNVTINQNVIAYNGFDQQQPNLPPNQLGGLYLRFYGPFSVDDNNITGNFGFGIQLGENCSQATIHDNNIMNNGMGVNLLNFATKTNLGTIRVDGYPLGVGNVVYSNNLIDNSPNALVEHIFPYNVTGVNNGTDVVSWDNGKVGNYWGDYQSKYPNASEVDASGLENTPYVIDQNNIDHFPLANQFDRVSTPTPTSSASASLIPTFAESPTQQPTIEPSPTPNNNQENSTSILIVAALVVAAVFVALLVYFAKRKGRSNG